MRIYTLTRAELQTPKRLLDTGSHTVVALQLDARRAPGAQLFVWDRAIQSRQGTESALGYDRVELAADAQTAMAGEIVAVVPGHEIWACVRPMPEGAVDTWLAATAQTLTIVAWELADMQAGAMPIARAASRVGMVLASYSIDVDSQTEGSVQRLLRASDVGNSLGMPISLRVRLQGGGHEGAGYRPAELVFFDAGHVRTFVFPGEAQAEVVVSPHGRGLSGTLETLFDSWELYATIGTAPGDPDATEEGQILVDVVAGILPPAIDYRLNATYDAVAGTGPYMTAAMMLPASAERIARLETYNHTAGATHETRVYGYTPTLEGFAIPAPFAGTRVAATWLALTDTCAASSRRSVTFGGHSEIVLIDTRFTVNPGTAKASTAIGTGRA